MAAPEFRSLRVVDSSHAVAVPAQARWGVTDRRDLWWVDPLLSPFYSPNLGRWTPLPQWLSPAVLILWAPGGFRLTCYYYRKAYYRSFTLHPPGCAVAEGRRGEYRGETA